MSTRIDYYSVWAERYDLQFSGPRRDLQFFRALALEADGLVVELGAGTGRLTIPIAAAGARVLGLELHAEMLAIARRKAREERLADRLYLAAADMRRFALREPAALIFVPARAFMHLLATEDQLSALDSCRQSLRPGGRLVLDVFNPDIELIVRWLHADPHDWEPMSGPWTAWRADYWPLEQRTRAVYRRELPDGAEERASFTLRWLYRYEMEHLLALAGFEVEAVYGDFDYSPLADGSPEQIWVARVPA